ncbi:esterase [Ktedonobacteria bacterium brp13]|nr:esterase [Ktedonobacteria bacterium brp13]
MDITTTMDSELRVAYEQFPSNAIPQNTNEFVAFRKAQDEELAQMNELPKNEHVVIEERVVPPTLTTPEVPVRIYTPMSRTGLLPALLWTHGGGFFAGNSAMDDPLLCRFVEEVECIVVSVEYRLAPEHPFPAGIDDCYAALTWLATNAQELGVNRDRLAIAGNSAGGGTSAAVALMARDRGEVNLCFQMPLYACLDDRHITSSSHEITDARTWSREISLQSWAAYLGTDSKDDVSPYAAPNRASNLAGLPPTYMMVGDHDLLRDENIAYANRLMQAGCQLNSMSIQGLFMLLRY